MAVSNEKSTSFGHSKRLVKYLIILLLLLLLADNIFSQAHKADDSYSLKVVKNGILLHTFSLKSLTEIKQAHFYYFHTNPVIYLFLVPGFLIFLAFFIKPKSVTQALIIFCFFSFTGIAQDFPEEEITGGIKYFKAENYKSALDAFNMAVKKEKDNPALLYNKALCHYMLNQKGLALYALRQSLKTNPQDHIAQKVLAAIELEAGLKFQISPVQTVHPNQIFIVLILLFNFALIALGLVFRYRQGTLFIIFVFFIFAFFSAFCIFIGSLIELNAQTGVIIVKEGVLKKIPLDKAQRWFNLKEGTSVKINGFAQDYALIKTGLGFEGWIKKAQLITD